jgi:hypothetical protein
MKSQFESTQEFENCWFSMHNEVYSNFLTLKETFASLESRTLYGFQLELIFDSIESYRVHGRQQKQCVYESGVSQQDVKDIFL